jgi:hypothetical protein
MAEPPGPYRGTGSKHAETREGAADEFGVRQIEL